MISSIPENNLIPCISLELFLSFVLIQNTIPNTHFFIDYALSWSTFLHFDLIVQIMINLYRISK